MMKTGYKAPKKSKKAESKGYLMAPNEMKPTVSLDTSLLPDIKNWKVGKTYKVTLEIKQTGLHVKYGSDGLCADFEIVSAEKTDG